MESIVYKAVAAALAVFFTIFGGFFDGEAKKIDGCKVEKGVPEGYESACPELVEPDARRNPPVESDVPPTDRGLEGQDRSGSLQSGPGRRLLVQDQVWQLRGLSTRLFASVGDSLHSRGEFVRREQFHNADVPAGGLTAGRYSPKGGLPTVHEATSEAFFASEDSLLPLRRIWRAAGAAPLPRPALWPGIS